jgi:hypothetical protein
LSCVFGSAGTIEHLLALHLADDRLELTAAQARQAVGAYLRSTGAYSRYPGLAYRVRVDPSTRSVEVSLRAPLDLPLTVPGSPEVAMIGATGSAVVDVDD